MKNHNGSVFLSIYMALTYVVMWRNKELSTKSQIFWFYIIYRYRYKDRYVNIIKIVTQVKIMILVKFNTHIYAHYCLICFTLSSLMKEQF